jgi:hypothetical protein
MARDSAEFAQQSGERAMQAATVGMTWARDFTEESFNQSRQAFDAFLRISRKMAEDFEKQASAMREHTTALTEKTLSNTMDYGQKLARAKEPQEIAQCQSEFMTRQAQVLSEHTKIFGEKMQKAAQEFAQTASGAMSEAAKRTADAPSLVAGVSSRAEQAVKRQRAEA